MVKQDTLPPRLSPAPQIKPTTAANDFDRAAMVAAVALEDFAKAWLKLPAELRQAILGEAVTLSPGTIPRGVGSNG